MGDINSLSGHKNVSMDFQPAVAAEVQNAGSANTSQPGADAVFECTSQQEKANVRGVIWELNVLLLNAAVRSGSADALLRLSSKTSHWCCAGLLSCPRSAETVVFGPCSLQHGHPTAKCIGTVDLEAAFDALAQLFIVG